MAIRFYFSIALCVGTMLFVGCGPQISPFSNVTRPNMDLYTPTNITATSNDYADKIVLTWTEGRWIYDIPDADSIEKNYRIYRSRNQNSDFLSCVISDLANMDDRGIADQSQSYLDSLYPGTYYYRLTLEACVEKDLRTYNYASESMSSVYAIGSIRTFIVSNLDQWFNGELGAETNTNDTFDVNDWSRWYYYDAVTGSNYTVCWDEYDGVGTNTAQIRV